MSVSVDMSSLCVAVDVLGVVMLSLMMFLGLASIGDVHVFGLNISGL